MYFDNDCPGMANESMGHGPMGPCRAQGPWAMGHGPWSAISSTCKQLSLTTYGELIALGNGSLVYCFLCDEAAVTTAASVTHVLCTCSFRTLEGRRRPGQQEPIGRCGLGSPCIVRGGGLVLEFQKNNHIIMYTEVAQGGGDYRWPVAMYIYIYVLCSLHCIDPCQDARLTKKARNADVDAAYSAGP